MSLMTDLPVTNDDVTHYCEIHTDVETELRCNKCERYMCAQCAVSTPIGYRCKQCVRQVEDRFFTGTQNDYLVAFAVVTGLSAVASAILSWLPGFIILTIFVAVFLGGVIAETAFRAIKHRRGRYTGEIAAAGAVVGGLLGGMIFAYFDYPAEYGQIADAYRAMGRVVPSEITRMGYILDNMLSLSVLIFTGVTAFIVYSRMKS